MFKSCRQPLTGFFLLRAAFFTFIVGGALPAHSQDFPAPQILRTLVHHQITSFQQDLALSAPVLSGNGNRIAFTDGPGTGSADKPNRIYAINADGTDQKEIDSYTSRCFCGSYVDISDDGSKVVSTDSVQLRIANADGSGAKSLVVLDSNEINDMKISGDGTKVFFRIYRNNGYLGPNGTDARTDIENGIWVVNADGTGLRQLVGRVQLAAVQGVQPGDLGFWATIHPFTSLDVSTDGSRIVFGTFNRAESGGYGQSVYGVNLDGTGLRQLLDRQGWVWNVALSADGSKVGYNASPVGVDSSLNEVGIMNFDGSERKPLFTKTDTSALQVSADGSKLFVGGSSYLFDTKTGDVTQLAQITPGSGGHTTVLYEGLFNATMSNSANRFSYVMSFTRCADCVNQPKQLARLDINPSDFGEAPTIQNPFIDPLYVLTEYRSNLTAKAEIKTSNKVEAAGANVFRNGLYDINFRSSGPYLYDDATHGDVTKDDRIFTSGEIQHGFVILREGKKETDYGPRTLRFQAEVRSADGRLHATALEYGPFQVVAEAPLPSVTHLYPHQAHRGGQLLGGLLEGKNLNGATAVQFLLNGKPDAKIVASNIVTLDSGRLTFDLTLAEDANIGDRVVQVTSPLGVSSDANQGGNVFTVTAQSGGAVSCPIPGDVNEDGKVNVQDATIVLRKAVGLIP